MLLYKYSAKSNDTKSRMSQHNVISHAPERIVTKKKNLIFEILHYIEVFFFFFCHLFNIKNAIMSLFLLVI